MRKYDHDSVVLICNKCGRTILQNKGILCEDVLHVEKVWGYFSERDGIRHSWDVCEECYKQMIQEFLIPPQESEEIELI